MAEFRCEEHLKCTFKCALDVSCFEIEIYSFLLKNNPTTAGEIAKTMGKDKSSVYRALQNLVDKGLVIQEYRILRHGGYVHVYKPVPFEDFRDKMISSINEWVNTLLRNIKEIREMEEEKLVRIL